MLHILVGLLAPALAAPQWPDDYHQLGPASWSEEPTPAPAAATRLILDDPTSWSASTEVLDDNHAWFRRRRSVTSTEEEEEDDDSTSSDESLTLLLVAPIITARRPSLEDLGVDVPQAWGDFLEHQSWGSLERRPVWGSLETLVYDPEEEDDGEYGRSGGWLRRKRSADAPEEDMETAEQVLFRPTFRYKQLVKQRKKHQLLLEELHRRSGHHAAASSHAAVTAIPPKPASSQGNYYNAYQQQNQRVYSSQVSPVQRVYSQASPTRVYSQTSTPQRVYSQSQRVYSPQSSPTRRVYATNSPGPIPNYYSNVRASSQYPLQYARNEVYRPQRSSYAYYYQG